MKTNFSILEFALISDHNVVQARQYAKEIACFFHLSDVSCVQFATAVSEIARNAVQYAQNAHIHFGINFSEPCNALYAHITDSGPGFNPSECLQSNKSHGLSGSKKLMDIFEVESSPQKGSSILISKFLPISFPSPSPIELEQFQKKLSQKSYQIPVKDLLDQNHEFMKLLGEASEVREKLLQLNKELEETNQGMVALYAELDHKSQDLMRSNRELEAFSYSVSHDLRAPLHLISGFSQILLENYGVQLDEQGRNYLTKIRENCSRMAQLINDLLRLSHTIRDELKKEKFNLSEVATHIVTQYQENHPERTIQFTLAPELFVLADRRFIIIALENLLGNALKFTSKKDIAQIELGSLQENNSAVYFIKDNGAGFDSKDAENLFGVFKRLHTQEEFPGTGIGLALVKRIIERHHGKIWVESQKDKGSTFYFTLNN